ncbi:MAG TPA: hypothetical protein VK960_08180 [Acidimicrobiia bacterium]|nr:hypothetical protein [Acidimicrobiia bacterium]
MRATKLRHVPSGAWSVTVARAEAIPSIHLEADHLEDPGDHLAEGPGRVHLDAGARSQEWLALSLDGE